MDTSILQQMGIQVILIGLNAIFACAEIAVLSVNEHKMSQMAENGNAKAKRLVKLLREPARFLATIQVAITLAGFLGSAFAADNFSDMLVKFLKDIGVKLSDKTLDTLAVMVITVILSYFTLVLGELVPKRLAMKKAESLSLAMSALISLISKVFAPIVWFLTVSVNGVLRLCGMDPNEEEKEVSEEDVCLLLEEGAKSGSIAPEETKMIHNIFNFDDLPVGEFATRRNELDLLWVEDSLEEWEKTIFETGHTLYPICDESKDDVIGILNTKEYFRLKNKSRSNIMKHAAKKPYFIPKSQRASTLFRHMKESHNHFAVVIDEYGGVVGIVTMNDLLEQLVGEFCEN